jgi:hypothetical protein
MRAKLTILFCAVLVLALVASQAEAQGFKVRRQVADVIEGGNNQIVGALAIEYIPRESGTTHLSAGNEITVTYMGLSLHGGNVMCAGALSTNAATTGTPGPCESGIELTIANDEDTGVGSATIELDDSTDNVNALGAFVILQGVRADVSGLEVGEEIRATVSTEPTVDDFTEIDEVRTDTVATVVARVKRGLTVSVDGASRLLCNPNGTFKDIDPNTGLAVGTEKPIGGDPTITVSEGFDGAWESETEHTGTIQETWIRVVLSELPEGVTVVWPQMAITSTNGETGDDLETYGTLTYSTAMHDEDNPHIGMFAFADGADEGAASFDIVFKEPDPEGDGDANTSDSLEDTIGVIIGDDVAAAALLSAQVTLAPVHDGDDDMRGTRLAYSIPLMPDPAADFLNITDCVTYLLFPYITCGATTGWSTGISIANTTEDDGVFGLNPGAPAQSGPVHMWAYHRSEPAGDGGSGVLDDAVTAMISPNLDAGDTVVLTCNDHPDLAGVEGYAIARAGFQLAHGMAFVINTAPGSAVHNVAHGYIALVIPDPEIKGQRALDVTGESLGQ